MEDIREAITILKNGGIVIFPTDTVYGIGCRMDNAKAVNQLFRIRKRPRTQAAPVLVDSVAMAQNYLAPITQEVMEQLMKPYWPGALTIVLKCKVDKVPKLVRGGGDTLGVRIPNHPLTLELIRKVGVPILGPSANFHGEKTPFKFEDLDPELTKLADYVLVDKGSLERNVSTVIDCSIKPWKILREGAVKIDL